MPVSPVNRSICLLTAHNTMVAKHTTITITCLTPNLERLTSGSGGSSRNSAYNKTLLVYAAKYLNTQQNCATQQEYADY